MAPSSHEAVVSVEPEQTLEAGVVELASDLALAAGKAVVSTGAEALGVRVVAVSVGRIMTSLLATVMQASTSALTGSCSRRLTSTAWPS